MRVGKVLLSVALLLCGIVSAQAQTIDEVYKKALTEGGTLNFYGTLARINAEIILPLFEKCFPGIKANHVDATADQLATRIIAEARGGPIRAGRAGSSPSRAIFRSSSAWRATSIRTMKRP